MWRGFTFQWVPMQQQTRIETLFSVIRASKNMWVINMQIGRMAIKVTDV